MDSDFRDLMRRLEARRDPLSIEAAKAIRALTCVSGDAATFGRLTVYFDGRNPEIDGKPVMLTRRELEVLQALARKRRHLTAEELFSSVWGLDSEREIGIVKVYVMRLRRALSGLLGFGPVNYTQGRGYILLGAQA